MPSKSFHSWLLVAGLITCFLCPAETMAATDEATAQVSFEEFVKSWMVKLEKISQKNSRDLRPERSKEGYSGQYVSYGPEYRLRIKKTEAAETPYVGFLHYQEKHIVKKGRTPQEVSLDPGKVASEIEVTEIFRYTRGQWAY